MTVDYSGYHRKNGRYGKRSAISSATVMNGAVTVAKELTAVLAKKPAGTRTVERLTVTSAGKDVCKVVAQQTVDHVTPKATVTARNRNTTDPSTAGPTGQATLLTGRRIVEVAYRGAMAPNRPGAGIATTPPDANVVSAAAEASRR
ncbi:hypothetical protein FE391_06245 [Nonomuraea sp. KC401]|nr:hypothetical protein FE391_06245 [Nonomuraea sp. KC401]